MIYKFKRYEDTSLRYTGIDKHEGQDIGGWDTIMERDEYDHLFSSNHSYTAPPIADVIPSITEKLMPEKSSLSPAIQPRENKPSTLNANTEIVVSSQQSNTQDNKSELDLNVTIGSVVIHKVFGEGTVTQLDKVLKHIRVSFVKDEKAFVFPDAFMQGFLRTKE